MPNDETYMKMALLEAQKAFDLGEVPVGAVLVQGDQVIGKGYNQPILSRDATAHAEIVAIRDAGNRVENYRLPDTTLFVTVEPCTMCFGALVHARVSRIVYGASEPKAGALEGKKSLLTKDCYNHQFQITAGVMQQDCSQLISDFFKMRRAQKRNH